MCVCARVRVQVESLRMQLSRQKEEKSKVMKLLANCQEELADTVRNIHDFDYSYSTLFIHTISQHKWHV